MQLETEALLQTYLKKQLGYYRPFNYSEYVGKNIADSVKTEVISIKYDKGVFKNLNTVKLYS